MLDQDTSDPTFDVMTSRLLRREALRRAAEELNTASPLGLEDALARISAEVTTEALYRHETIASVTTSGVTGAPLGQKRPKPK
jgi:phage shock protein A